MRLLWDNLFIDTLSRMLHRILASIEGVLSYFLLPTEISAKVVLRALNVHGHCDTKDVEKYRAFKKNTAHAVVIFNHPTFFDHIVIMNELADTPRFVMLKKYMIGPLSWIATKLGVIGIDTSSGAAKVISNEITKRRANEQMVAISPSGGKVSRNRSWFLYPFKTGAFITKPAVLPIVIHYAPYEPWCQGTPMMQQMIQRFKGSPLSYTMRVLDPMYPKNDEDISTFAERCRRSMMHELVHKHHKAIDHQTGASIDCMLTCHLFLICGVVAISNHLFLYGIGMCIVFLTSWMYHGTASLLWRHIDIASNMMMIIVFGLMLLKSRQYNPLMILSFAAVSYALNLDHAVFVHIPIALGFSMITQ